MNKTPLVSVIVPVYNQEKWIGRCLRSIINQEIERTNYEIIVINDGSSDRTSFALEQFSDEIVLITNEENRGLPAALNKGIKLSKGAKLYGYKDSDLTNFNLKNIDLLIRKNLIENNLIKPIYLS